MATGRAPSKPRPKPASRKGAGTRIGKDNGKGTAKGKGKGKGTAKGAGAVFTPKDSHKPPQG